jgi:hypothetical protein
MTALEEVMGEEVTGEVTTYTTTDGGSRTRTLTYTVYSGGSASHRYLGLPSSTSPGGTVRSDFFKYIFIKHFLKKKIS